MTKDRKYDIDWVRAIVTIVVLFFHCARYFDHEGWHVKNPELSVAMDYVVGLLALWIMPMFFVLSGFSAFYSLSRRSTGAFAKARLTRLLVPFLFGTLVLIPPQVYIERASHGDFQGSFFEFFPRYFDGLYAFGGNFAWMGLHLWYLEALFLFSFLMLPLFVWLKKRPPSEASIRLWQKPGAILLWALPIVFVQALVELQPDGVGQTPFGGWSLLVYVVFFVLGYVAAQDARFRVGFEKSRWVAAGFAAVLIAVSVAAQAAPSLGEILGTFLRRSIIRPITSWAVIVSILGFAVRHFQFDNPSRQYANEAVLPFYMFHQTVIVVLGFLILGWNANVFIKYVALILGSFAIIMILYEGVVRRFGPLRWLFGMTYRRRR